MSNRFLTSGSGNLSDGTQNILGSNIGATNLLGGSTVKVNSLRQLVSTDLLISDIQGLSSTLGGKISNPSTVPITATSFVKTGGQNYEYLMADSSVTTSSGAGGNTSNIYLYDNSINLTPTPANGQIRYNDAVQEDDG